MNAISGITVANLSGNLKVRDWQVVSNSKPFPACLGGIFSWISKMLSLRNNFTVIQNGLHADRTGCGVGQNEIIPVRSERRVNQNEFNVIQSTLRIIQSGLHPIQSESSLIQIGLNVIRNGLHCHLCRCQFEICQEKPGRNECEVRRGGWVQLGNGSLWGGSKGLRVPMAFIFPFHW